VLPIAVVNNLFVVFNDVVGHGYGNSSFVDDDGGVSDGGGGGGSGGGWWYW